MKRPLLLAAVLVLLHQSPAMCQWYDVESGAPVADSSWRKTKDGFGAVLVVTDEFNSSRLGVAGNPCRQFDKAGGRCSGPGLFHAYRRC